MSLLPISKPVAEMPLVSPAAPVPRFVCEDPLSPSLVEAYLAWRRVKTVSSYVEGAPSDFSIGGEEDALCSFTTATAHVERKHREVVLSHPAPTGGDKLLKLRCLLEYDRDIFDDKGGEIAPDLAQLAMLVTIPEPNAVERPETDGQRRDFLTAWPDAIVHQPPADLLRLFTPEEGAEIFALAAGYRAAKETGSALLPDLIESLEAYGLYAAWHGGFEMVAPDYVPGLILTQEERLELGELGHLSASTVERLDAASSARQEEARERERQAEAETKAKQAAADRAKHGPPTAERLIPLLPSFSEKAREAASSILINADMMSTIHGMIAKHAAVLQTHELEELRRFDITTLKDRFEAQTQDILRQELDRLIRGRQAEVAP